MTIGDTVADDHYGDPRRPGRDLAGALNVEVLALAEAIEASAIQAAPDCGLGFFDRQVALAKLANLAAAAARVG